MRDREEDRKDKRNVWRSEGIRRSPKQHDYGAPDDRHTDALLYSRSAWDMKKEEVCSGLTKVFNTGRIHGKVLNPSPMHSNKT